MMKKLVLFLMLMLTLVLAGCEYEKMPESKETSVGYTMTDSRGKVISFSEPPQRIVLMSYSAGDILTEFYPLDRFVATDIWCKEEDLSNCYTQVGKLPKVEDNIEHILKFKPDLVILSYGRQNTLADALDSIEVRNCVLKQPTTIYEIPEYIRLVGSVVNESQKAAEMANRVQSYLDKRQDNPRVSGVLLMHPNGGTGHRGSMGDSIMEVCNIENVATKYKDFKGYYLGKEQIVELNPERIIVMEWMFGGQHESAAVRKADMLADPSYQSVKAIRDGKLIILPMKYFNCNSQYVIQNMEKLKAEIKKTL